MGSRVSIQFTRGLLKLLSCWPAISGFLIDCGGSRVSRA
jgi:hypothetical protein